MSENTTQNFNQNDIEIDNSENLGPPKSRIRNSNKKKHMKTNNRPLKSKMKYTCWPQHVGNNIALVFRTVPKETSADNAFSSRKESEKLGIEIATGATLNATNDVEPKKGDSVTDTVLIKDLNNFIDKSISEDLSSSGVNEMLQGASDYLKNFSKSNDNEILSRCTTTTTDSTTEKSTLNKQASDQFAFQIHITEKDLNDLMRLGKIFFFEGKICYKSK